MDDGLSNATINRELSALKKMFNLGADATPPKVNKAMVPRIRMLEESNTRKGFFEVEEFLRLRDALPDYLKPVVTFAYHTGWRAGEILNLTWDSGRPQARNRDLEPWGNKERRRQDRLSE